VIQDFKVKKKQIGSLIIFNRLMSLCYFLFQLQCFFMFLDLFESVCYCFVYFIFLIMSDDKIIKCFGMIDEGASIRKAAAAIIHRCVIKNPFISSRHILGELPGDCNPSMRTM
jgi:hypothetical protein